VLALQTPRAFGQGGIPLWTNRYNGAENWDDKAVALTIDSTDNVIVTGYSASASNGYDFVTIKYSNAGLSLWTNRYVGPGKIQFPQDYARALSVDTNDNIFVTGSSQSTNGFNEHTTIKYSSVGTPLWTNRCNGPGEATAIVVDSVGNVFVTGFSYNATSLKDYATVKYSNGGTPLWTNRYSGNTSGDDAPTAVAADKFGNVFVTGKSWNGSNYDYVTVSYSNAGVPLWTNRFNGSGNGDDYAMAEVVDENGNLIVTGYSFVGNFSSSYAYVTIKYSGAGVPLWTNRYKGPDIVGGSVARAVGVDSSGNVFVTGSAYFTSNEGSHIVTIAYSGAGTPIWTNVYIGPWNGSEIGWAIALDRDGNVIVTGQSYSGIGNFDYVTIAYSNIGLSLWTNRFRGPGNGEESGVDAAVDRSGNVFVTGYSKASNDLYDYATIKYSSSIPRVYLDFRKAMDRLVLSWTNSGFGLQSAPASSGTFTNLTGATSPYTNPITGAQQFFRLKKN